MIENVSADGFLCVALGGKESGNNGAEEEDVVVLILAHALIGFRHAHGPVGHIIKVLFGR